ncbi:MAG TPA: AMP-binding protein [Acidimicrobiales bacterium]|nr:AMP-binding protein [Acidimicrobiales bacterium]
MPLLPWRAHLPAGDGLAAGDLTARVTLPAAWAATWAADPGARVLLDTAGGRGAWCTAGELDERSAAMAARLIALGLGPSDRVVWSAPSSVAAVVANVAALRAGLVVVPANPAYTARELAHIVDDAQPSLAIVDDPDRARAMDLLSPVPVVDLDVVPVAGPSPAPARHVAPSATTPGSPRADDPALVAYTSGTTGAPKGAVLTHANLLANSAAVAATWRWGPDDVLVHALPVFHGHGLCVALYTTLLVGSSAVLLPRFDVDAVFDARAEHRATMFFGVPTMYHRLAASPRVGELRELRVAVSGSAPLRAELHRHIASAGGTTVLERYGTTETLMLTSNPYDGERRAGTVGFPFPGVEVRVEAEESGPGEGGEILARGPAVFQGYWRRPGATAERFTDGWYRTGDLGAVEDGYLRILGRSAELIISGGYNVYPAEVEDVLLAHPAVVEVAVAGTPSDEWGEVVTAWVVSDGAPDAESLLAFAADRLAPYKQPRLVRFVDALPRNPMGKVVRSALGDAGAR